MLSKIHEWFRLKTGAGNLVDKQYLDIAEYIMKNGEDVGSRNAMVRKAFGFTIEIDLADGFPVLTSKQTFWKQAVAEMIGFNRALTSNQAFVDLGCKVWTDNANADYWINNPNNQHKGDDLGVIYGVQSRKWNGNVDQLQNAIDSIFTNPHDRRMVVSHYNPSEFDKMALPPCHVLYQFFVRDGEYLDMQMYQRSADLFLGVPFNMVGYAAQLMMVAKLTGLKVGKFRHVLGDTHIYHLHFDAIKEMLSNRNKTYNLPTMKLEWPVTDFAMRIETFEPEDFELKNYQSCGKIIAPMIA